MQICSLNTVCRLEETQLSMMFKTFCVLSVSSHFFCLPQMLAFLDNTFWFCLSFLTEFKWLIYQCFKNSLINVRYVRWYTSFFHHYKKQLKIENICFGSTVTEGQNHPYSQAKEGDSVRGDRFVKLQLVFMKKIKKQRPRIRAVINMLLNFNNVFKTKE